MGVTDGCVTGLSTPSCFLELVIAVVLLVDAAVLSLEDGSEVYGLRGAIDVKGGCTVSLVLIFIDELEEGPAIGSEGSCLSSLVDNFVVILSLSSFL